MKLEQTVKILLEFAERKTTESLGGEKDSLEDILSIPAPISDFYEAIKAARKLLGRPVKERSEY